jgi:thioredoxin reductase (NADPH)
VPCTWVDVEQDATALALVERVNQGKRIIPTIVFGDGSTLIEPSDAELATRLGLQTHAKLAFADRPNHRPLRGPRRPRSPGDRAQRSWWPGGVTERLDNFPGFPDGIGGAEFADRLVLQARRFGVELLQAQKVASIRVEAQSHYVTTADGAEYGARALLIATGSTYRRLGIPGEDELIGAGVHFCATCDGPFYRDRPVAVIGGGNSAGEESLFLARFANRITLLVRGPEMTASKIVVDKLAENPKIELLTNTETIELHGEGKLNGITIRDRQSGSTRLIDPAGVFVFIGLAPNSGWLPPAIKRDQAGFVVTNPMLETSLPGVFAAGDVRQGSTKQAASAAGEGATAALMIREYLKTI